MSDFRDATQRRQLYTRSKWLYAGEETCQHSFRKMKSEENIF